MFVFGRSSLKALRLWVTELSIALTFGLEAAIKTTQDSISNPVRPYKGLNPVQDSTKPHKTP